MGYLGKSKIKIKSKFIDLKINPQPETEDGESIGANLLALHMANPSRILGSACSPLITAPEVTPEYRARSDP